jgi:hypothetical protein
MSNWHLKVEELLQEIANELSLQFDMRPPRIKIDWSDVFKSEPDRVAFSNANEIIVNMRKVPLPFSTDDKESFKATIKWELLWVWSFRNGIEPWSPQFMAKGKEVGVIEGSREPTKKKSSENNTKEQKDDPLGIR